MEARGQVSRASSGDKVLLALNASEC